MSHQKNLYSINELVLYSVGRQKCAPRHSYATSYHNRFLIHFVLAGRGKVRYADGREYDLSRGEAFLIGNREGYYEADDKDPWTYVWINISGEEVVRFLDCVDFNVDSPIYKTCDPDQISNLCEELCNSFYKQENIFRMMKNLFSLLEVMIETSMVKKEEPLVDENQYVELCKKYILENYNKKISADDLSKCTGIEYSYLFRLFKEQVGVAPILFSINYKMLKAAELIEKNNVNINEAAACVGYDDRILFSKMFKKYIGVSPQKYKSDLTRNIKIK